MMVLKNGQKRAAFPIVPGDLSLCAAMVRHYEECPTLVLIGDIARCLHSRSDRIAILQDKGTGRYWVNVFYIQRYTRQAIGYGEIETQQCEETVHMRYSVGKEALADSLQASTPADWRMSDTQAYQQSGWHCDNAKKPSEVPSYFREVLCEMLQSVSQQQKRNV